MKTLNLMALDFGASNGRALLGQFDGEKLSMEELHRFSNDYLWVNGLLYWDCFDLYRQILRALAVYGREYGPRLDGIAIDTWGVDYGLVDRQGQICGHPLSYRMSVDGDMEAFWRNVMDKRALFDRTGLAANNFNTVYQLYARLQRGDAALETADKLLLLPDLLAYMLSGEMGSEYTMAMTTQLCDPHTKDWDYELLEMMGLSSSLFIPVSPACTPRGALLPEIATGAGIRPAPVLAVGGHDTASAVAAVPGHEDFVFLSSGTWSLFGTESPVPIRSDAVFQANYSNEGSIQGGFRPLKNIMGLWIIQQLRREWLRQGLDYNWDEIVAQARQAAPFASLIDPDYPAFFSAEDMTGAIARYCHQTGQSAPESVGAYARCVYESLALKYRWATERIEAIRGGRRVETLHIVGGGSQNRLLNQMSANAIARPVIAGPIEGASIGNLLGQAMALGEIHGIDQLRDIVRASFPVEEYQPEDTPTWEDAYGRFLQITGC